MEKWKVVIEFFENNLIVTMIAVFSVIFNIYQFLLNRKLKGFEIEKKLTMKKAELLKLNNNYWERIAGIGAYDFRTSMFDRKKEENEYNYQKSCLEAEIEYLEKILKDKNK